MVTRRRLISSLVFLLVLFTLSGCASTSKQSSTGEYIDDSVITTKLKTQLAGDDFLKSFRISVETYKGVVSTERVCQYSNCQKQGGANRAQR